MQEFMGNITDFFTGKSNTPANPDIRDNINLLNETMTKIETLPWLVNTRNLAEHNAGK